MKVSIIGHDYPYGPTGVLYTFWVRGSAIGKGLNFQNLGIRKGIKFHDFGLNGINFPIGMGSGVHFQKIGIKLGIHFGKIGIYIQGMSMFLKPRWHVPIQNLVKYPRAYGKQTKNISTVLLLGSKINILPIP